MKSILLRGIAVIAAAMIAAAPLPAMTATPADQLIIGEALEIRSIDPHESNQAESTELIANTYDRLLDLPADDPKTLVPALAESWEVSEDGKVITFTLRRDAVFHSGNPVTAADAAWSLQRLVKLELAPSNELRQWGFTKDNVDALITAPDDRTLVVTLPEVWNPQLVLYSMASFATSIVDSKLLTENQTDGDMGRAYLASADAGSGPYKLDTWRPNEIIIASAVDGHWRGTPAMKRVIMRNVPESAAQRLQLEQGDIDVAKSLSSSDLDALSQNPNTNVAQVTVFGWHYLALNQKNEILAKPQVREAFRYLIDYDGLGSTAYKFYGKAQQTVIPEGMLGYLDEMPYTLDIEKAKALIAEAGYPEGFTVRLFTNPGTPNSEAAQALQANAAKAGITLELEIGDLIGRFRARDYDLYIGASAVQQPDPHGMLSSYASNPDNSDEANLGGIMAWRVAWDIPEMTEEVRAAAREVDLAKRQAMYEEINREYLASKPALITSFRRLDPYAHAASLVGYVGHPTWLTRWDVVTKN